MQMRPPTFWIDRSHQLAQGLVFAGLGRFPGTTRYHDSSLYGNTGTLTDVGTGFSLPSMWTRKIGRSGITILTTADNTGTHILLPPAAAAVFTTSVWTASCWVLSSSTTQKICPFGCYKDDGHRMNQSQYSDGNLYWYASGSGEGHISAPAAGLHHIVWQYNAAGAGNSTRAMLWVDGVQQTLTYGTAIAATLDVGTDAVIGQYHFGTWGTNNSGTLLDPMIHTRLLSGSEISALARDKTT